MLSEGGSFGAPSLVHLRLTLLRILIFFLHNFLKILLHSFWMHRIVGRPGFGRRRVGVSAAGTQLAALCFLASLDDPPVEGDASEGASVWAGAAACTAGVVGGREVICSSSSQ